MKMSTLRRYFLTWLFVLTCCRLMEVFPQQTLECGLTKDNRGRRGKRVIGGNIARENAWPWLVNMIDKNDSLQYCSGTIIDEQWILTTAHCFLFYGSNNSVTYFPLTNYEYIVADHKYNRTDRHEYTVQPLQLFIHPKYKLADDFQPGDYDIALIKLKAKLHFTEQVKQACLPTNNTRFDPATSCYLAGWGNIVNTKDYSRSSILREVQLDLVPFSVCNSRAAYNGTIPKTFRCAGYSAGGRDGCYGDSGAPLQCCVQGRWTVAGLMSWGDGCGKPNRYGVYTDVQNLWSTFIKPVLKGSVDRLTTYLKRPLSRFAKNWKVDQKSFYLLFTKHKVFSDIDLVRNFQFIPMQITLLKNTTLAHYAAVMNTSVQSLMSKTRLTSLNQIVVGFKQHSKEFEKYKINMISKMNNQTVAQQH